MYSFLVSLALAAASAQASPPPPIFICPKGNPPTGQTTKALRIQPVSGTVEMGKIDDQGAFALQMSVGSCSGNPAAQPNGMRCGPNASGYMVQFTTFGMAGPLVQIAQNGRPAGQMTCRMIAAAAHPGGPRPDEW